MIITAARSQPRAFLALRAASDVAWWITAERMGGMDTGPGTNLGTVGWFTGVRAVMMAAMMRSSLAPAIAVSPGVAPVRVANRTALFAGGYHLSGRWRGLRSTRLW